MGMISNMLTKMAANQIKSAAYTVLSAAGNTARGSAGEVLCANIVNLPEETAKTRCKNLAFKIRIVSRDNKNFILTGDHKTDRINLTIKNGIVTKAYVG
jgi:hypothetical protein